MKTNAEVFLFMMERYNVPRYLVIDFSKADKDFTASDEDKRKPQD